MPPTARATSAAHARHHDVGEEEVDLAGLAGGHEGLLARCSASRTV